MKVRPVAIGDPPRQQIALRIGARVVACRRSGRRGGLPALIGIMEGKIIAGAVLTITVLLPFAGCSSFEGEVDHSVYTPPDESFDLRLPAGAKRGAIKEDTRGGGVGFEGKGERTWKVQHFAKGAHLIARADADLPLATRLLFAESAWAQLTGLVARPVIEREILTLNDGRQAVLSVRRVGTTNRSGLHGVLIFETDRRVWLLDFRDPALADQDLVEARRELVRLDEGLTVHDG